MPAPIGLIAALPNEIRPLLAASAPISWEDVGQFRIYRFQLAGRSTCLVAAGMGRERALAATEALISTVLPGVIVSFGFGGAVLPGLVVGDLVVGRDYCRLTAGGCSPRTAFDRNLVATVTGTVGGIEGTIITTDRIVAKRELMETLPEGIDTPVLDMETAAVAEAAQRHHIPLLALRAISDDAREELSFSLDEFTDNQMTIRPSRVLGTILRKPWIIPQLMRLASNGRNAARTLATALTAVVPLLTPPDREP